MDVVFQAEEQEGTSAVVAQWLVTQGDEVNLHQPLLEVETDKVTVEVVAPEAGRLAELVVAEGDALEPGQVVARLSSSTRAESNDTSVTAPSMETANDELGGATRPRLSPAVRQLLNQHALNVDDVVGTGSRGRVTVQDIERHLEQEQPVVDAPGGDSRIPHSPMRRRIATHMVESLLHTAPHVTSVFDADLSRILAHRSAHKSDFAKRGVNLTLSAYFVQAAVCALTEVPQVNSRFHEDYLEVFAQQHIGVGTALGDDGLVVPVVRNAESLDLFATARELQRLVDRARNKKLTSADLEGGTFSISNHGVSGSLVATPIVINQPQSAILGVGKLEKRVVVRELAGQEAMVIRPMCYVSLTIDHRALDAHQTNRFLTAFVATLEDWPNP